MQTRIVALAFLARVAYARRVRTTYDYGDDLSGRHVDAKVVRSELRHQHEAENPSEVLGTHLFALNSATAFSPSSSRGRAHPHITNSINTSFHRSPSNRQRLRDSREPTMRIGKSGVYPKRVYDPDAAREYFERRPFEVAGRAVSLLTRSASFGVALLADFASGELQSRADQRAGELRELLTKLGPTFIKAGQSASIRTDLLPVEYIRGLTQLQDQVPPYPTEQARDIIKEDFGGNFPFARLSDEPIAAASLGQVYKGWLRNGTEVAVKVQRPDMEHQVALDMYLIRDIFAPLASAFGVPGDLIGIADAWGKGFVDELNYEEEGANAERFNSDVRQSPLNGKVFAPCVVNEASSSRVLTTVWIDGERLDRCSTPEDVPRLCSLAMNTYLEMMLDTGVLHCDPHPGNLLRTGEGKLCILDWGLVTCIKPDLQLTLIEHVAHLTAKDYAKIPNDLVQLGFVPAGAEDVVVQNGVVDFLTDVYSTWGSGGGAAKLDVPKLFDEVNQLAQGTQDGIFQVPPYFAYIAKGFSVLEGIGLSIDPEYSIIDETLPYISTRIISDPSPRTAGALETFIFGESKGDVESRVLNAGRVETLFDGAKRYAASTVIPSGGDGSFAGETPSSLNGADGASSTLTVAGLDIDAASDAIFDVLLSKESTPVQEIILEQLGLIIGASLRETWADLRRRSGAADSLRDRSVLGTLVDPLGLFKGSPLIEVDSRDREVLAAASKLASIAADLLENSGNVNLASLQNPAELNTADGRRLVQVLSRKLWARREALQLVSQRLAVKLLDQTAQRGRISKQL